MQFTIHSPKCVIAAVAAGVLVAGAAAPVAASAASVPQSSQAQLQAALQGLPVSTGQIQALVSDLAELNSGGAAPTLGADLDAVLAQIGQGSGEDAAVQPVLNTVNSLIGTTPTTAGIAQVVAQLEGLVGSGDVSRPVGQALSQLASGLTSADLSALLGQPGSPLTPAAVQQILADLAELQAIPGGQSVPTGVLSAVSAGLETLAAQPGVPATASSALDGVAAELGSGSDLTDGALTPALQTLAAAMPALASTPGDGAAYSSVLGALATELAASPAAGSGSGGSGTPTGASGSASYVQDVQSAPTASTAATIRALRYRKGHLFVTVACPADVKGRCHTTVYLKVGANRVSSEQLTIAPDKTHVAKTAVTSSAVKRANGRKVGITVTAVTGASATARTIHTRIK
jgi:hypothetical protein